MGKALNTREKNESQRRKRRNQREDAQLAHTAEGKERGQGQKRRKKGEEEEQQEEEEEEGEEAEHDERRRQQVKMQEAAIQPCILYLDSLLEEQSEITPHTHPSTRRRTRSRSRSRSQTRGQQLQSLSASSSSSSSSSFSSSSSSSSSPSPHSNAGEKRAHIVDYLNREWDRVRGGGEGGVAQVPTEKAKAASKTTIKNKKENAPCFEDMPFYEVQV